MRNPSVSTRLYWARMTHRYAMHLHLHMLHMGEHDAEFMLKMSRFEAQAAFLSCRALYLGLMQCCATCPVLYMYSIHMHNLPCFSEVLEDTEDLKGYTAGIDQNHIT